MTFDFDTPINRAESDSRKWRKYAATDIIPLWIADMDFAAPPAVIEALHRRVNHGVFGYGMPLPPLTKALMDYCGRRYGWSIRPDWIVWLPGLVTGLNLAATAYGAPGDEILTCTPVYPPFLSAPKNQKRATVAVPMLRDEHHRYHFDWDAMERAVTPRTRQLFLCSPHNPASRVFAREELQQVAAFAERHNLTVVSDEIHCDLILDDGPHVPLATLSPETADRTVTLMAPSKTYNIPGLACSLAIIPNALLRTQLVRAMAGIIPEMNVLGFAACEAALRDSEPWRQGLLAYLRANRDLIATTVARDLPDVRLTPVEATYLAWLDISALKMDNPARHFEEHGIGIADGAQYGAPPGHFIRLNFGCTYDTLTEALTRLKRAIAAR